MEGGYIRMKMKQSLQKKVTGVLLMVILVVFLAMGVLNYWGSKKMLVNEIETNISIQSNSIATRVDSYFQQKSMQVKQMATNYSIVNYLKTIQTREEALTNPYYQDVLASLNKMVNIDKSLGLAWVASEQGNFLIGNGGLLTKSSWDINTRAWRDFALKSDNPVFSDPFVSLATGKNIINIVTKIMDGGKVIGYVAVDLLMDDFPNIMKEYKIGQTGYPILIGKNGSIMYHPEENLIFTSNIKEFQGDMLATGKKMLAKQRGIEIINNNGKKEYTSYSPVETTGWSVATFLPTEEANQIAKKFRFMLIIVNLLGVTTITLSISFILRWLLKDLPKIFQYVQDISNGDLTQSLLLNRSDEIGVLSKELNSFSSKMNNIVNNVKSLAQKVENDNLYLKETINNLISGKNSSILGKDNLEHGIIQLNNQMSLILDNVRNQTASSEESLAALEEISSTSKNMTDNIKINVKVFNDSLDIANDGVSKINELTEAAIKLNSDLDFFKLK